MPPPSGSFSLPPSNARNAPANTNAKQNESSPSELGGEVEIRFSNFKPDFSAIYSPSHVHRVIFSFECIKHNMDKQLAIELAEFLPNAWEQSLLSKARSPTDLEFYKKIRGTEHNQKQLYYPYWFFLATVWGTTHPSLATIRMDGGLYLMLYHGTLIQLVFAVVIMNMPCLFD